MKNNKKKKRIVTIIALDTHEAKYIKVLLFLCMIDSEKKMKRRKKKRQYQNEY